MKEIVNYNIHDILSFQIVRNKTRDILRNLNFPFSYFETKETLNNPDVIIYNGDFKPLIKECSLVDHRYFIKENYFFCKDSENGVQWKVEISGFEDDKTIVKFDGKGKKLPSLLIPDFLSQNLILRPLIEYKLAKKGYYLIHAAALHKNGKAFLFAGRGGSFKTSIVMDLVRNAGYLFMGDDRICITKDRVLAFPMHLPIFNFRVKNLKDENFENVIQKIGLFLQLYKKNNKNFTVPIISNSPLSALFIFHKTNDNSPMKTSIIDNEKATSILIASNKMEMIKSPMMMGMDFGCYYKYMLAYSFIYPCSGIAKYWDYLKTNIKLILENIPIYEIKLPQQYTVTISEQLHQLIEDIK